MNYKQKLTTSISGLISGLMMATPVQAAIKNPAIGNLGDSPEKAASGQTFTSYLVTIWEGVIFAGGLLLILYFIWGGIEWISAGGDAGKIGKARDKITQAVIGMIILVGSYTIIGFINQLFFAGQFDILNPSL